MTSQATEILKTVYKTVDSGDGTGTGMAKLQITLSRGDLKKNFKCVVESEALDEPIVSFVTADVNVKPTRIELSGVQNHVVTESNVKLVCNVFGAKPAAEVQWFNDSMPVPESLIRTELEAMPDGTVTTRSSLEFLATRWENENGFHCYAENSVIREQKDASLHRVLIIDVYYPPLVTVSPNVITVNETDENVLLSCAYHSNPMKLEDALWSKDGKNLTLGDNYEGGNVENLPLIIKYITREDHGNYTCICRNSVGSQESDEYIFLDVQFPPIVELDIFPDTPVKAVEEKNVTLACLVSQGNGNPTTLLKVRWFLGDELLKELPECNYTSYDESGKGEGSGGPLCSIDSHILSLVNVSEGFAGNYTCQGKNVAGWGPKSEPQELIVYYPPSPARLRATPSKVIKKTSVTLHCSVSNPGYPETISYVWYRGSHLVTDVTTPTWTINPVTFESKSNYTCFAVNEGGNGAAASIFVNVFAPPAFIQNLQPYQGILFTSTNISLTCRVECSPECSIIWLKNGQKIGNNSPYEIRITKHPPDLKKNDFESVESTLIFNMSLWPGEQLDKTAPNSFYTCQSSSNGIGQGVNSTMEIAVDYPPENLTVSKQIVDVVENSKPEAINCTGKGHPTLTYTWKNSQGVNISTSSVLSLKTVSISDDGIYTCEASNKHGKATTTARLNVLFVPSCTIGLYEYDGSPSLKCVATANPKEVTFRFQIKGENETVDSSLIIQEGTTGYLKLDSGVDTFRTYQCFVNNSVGIGSPCERDVVAYQEQSSQIGIPGIAPWWKQLFGDNLIIPITILAGIILVVILCIIIILICRRKRTNNKYNNTVEMEERENIFNIKRPDGQFSNSRKSKWPHKLSVFAHQNELRNMNITRISSLNQFKCTSVPRYDHKYKRSKKKIYYRLKDLFGLNDQDTLPLGIYRDSTAVTFKKNNAPTINTIKTTVNLPTRKRKKPGAVPNQSSLGDKGGLGAAPSSGGTADPLIDPDKLFYENLPFHGMQTPPNKPYRPEFSDLDYADVDYRSYGPINYKAASIYAAMKKKKESGKLEEKDDDLL